MRRVEFGVDGIRYLAGQWPLTRRGAYLIGRALGRYACARSDHASVVIGRDTRPSGQRLADRVASGLSAEGVHVVDLGIMTTPGVAYVARQQRAVLGINVSASHNPVQYNGIKVVDGYGLRLQREEEIEIERWIDLVAKSAIDRGIHGGQVSPGDHLTDLYIQDHVRRCPVRVLDSLQVVLDCANGAASYVAPEVFARLGARVVVINKGDSPRGGMINHQCGSEHVRRHPECLIDLVQANAANYGFAFDGDGDRLVAVDAEGGFYDGDDLLFALASYHHARGLLRGGTVVTTTTSNTGLGWSLAEIGIQTLIVSKGDKALEGRVWRDDYLLGAEPTGNVIINDGHHTAADAIYTAVVLGGVLCDTGLHMRDLTRPLKRHPQVLVSFRLEPAPAGPRRLVPPERLQEVEQERQRALKDLGQGGRVLIWRSSTEPGYFRAMVEGPVGCAVADVRREALAMREAVRQAVGRDVGWTEVLTPWRM